MSAAPGAGVEGQDNNVMVEMVVQTKTGSELVQEETVSPKRVVSKKKLAPNGQKVPLIYNELPISIKVDLIKDYETQNCSQRSLARKYKVSRATVNQIIKQKHRYLAEWEKMRYMAGTGSKANSNCLTLKRFRKTNVTTVNQIMEEFVEAARINKWEITGPKLKQRAKEVAAQLGLNEFKASNGWLDSFKKRCSLEFSGNGAGKDGSRRRPAPSLSAMETQPQGIAQYQSSIIQPYSHQITTEATVSYHDMSHVTPQSTGNPQNTWVIGYATASSGPQVEVETDQAVGSISSHQQVPSQQQQQLPSLQSISMPHVSSHQLHTEVAVATISEQLPLSVTRTQVQVQAKAKVIKKKPSSKLLRKLQRRKSERIEVEVTLESEEDESTVKVPHISRVRDAIDTLERFAITKMPTLLPTILSMRQDIGNFVIQQQMQHHQQQQQQQLHQQQQQQIHQQQQQPQQQQQQQQILHQQQPQQMMEHSQV